eukprot:scaffold521_cov177-Ochromonas_danica.AAC.14
MLNILKDQTKRRSSAQANYVLPGGIKVTVKKEDFRLRGEEMIIKRLYVQDPKSRDPVFGWVVEEGIHNCMVCGEPFSMMRWSHHCRCCGNIVCSPCSPNEVEVVELRKYGPVRVCVLCYWGQEAVHAYLRQEETIPAQFADERQLQFSVSSENPETEKPSVVSFESPSPLETPHQREPLQPTALFVVEFHRKLKTKEIALLSPNGSSSIAASGQKISKDKTSYINICMHDVMMSLSEEQEFVVCDEVYTTNQVVNGKEKGEADVYHALLRPDLIEAYFAADSIDQFEEVASIIVNEILVKFHLVLIHKPEILSALKYVGNAEEMTVQLPVCLTPVTFMRGLHGNFSMVGFPILAKRSVNFVASSTVSDDERGSIAGLLARNSARRQSRLMSNTESSLSCDSIEHENTSMKILEIRKTDMRPSVGESAANKTEADRLAAEKAEADRVAAAKAEADKFASEKAEADRVAAAEAEADRLAAEKAEADRADRLAAEKAEADRVAAAKAEADRLAAEKAEADRVAAAKAEADRLAAEKAERDRLVATKAEADRLAVEKVKSDRLAAEKAERDRLVAAKAEADRLAAEKVKADEAAAVKAEADRVAAAKVEADRLAAEKLEADRLAAEKVEADRLAAEKAEADKVAAEKAEADRLAVEKVDAVRVDTVEKQDAPFQSGDGEKVAFPAIDVEATPWSVLKTKKADGKKVFVNVLYHAQIPAGEEEESGRWREESFQAYLKQNFVVYSLNKAKHVMHIGEKRDTADKEGGSSLVLDVTVHPSVFVACSKDEVLCDKLYAKVIKAVSRKLNEEVDGEYKMPKILKNYKGNEVLPLRVPIFRFIKDETPAAVSSSELPASTVIADEAPVKGPVQVVESAPTTVPPVPSTPPRQPSVASPSPVSTLSSSSKPAASRTDFSINAEWNNRWKAYLPTGYNVVYTSSTAKRNRLGMKIVRQLILTDQPSLIYVDVSKNVLKGTIVWTKTSLPEATKVNGNTFTVTTPSRVYKFEDQQGNNADEWVKRINAMAKLTARRSFVAVPLSSSGIYHPDEYFQHIEPVAKAVYGLSWPSIPEAWEWQSNYRIRSFLPLLPAITTAKLLNFMGVDDLPVVWICRLLQLALVVIADVHYFLLAELLSGEEAAIFASIVSLCSWSGGYMLPRTLINSMECCLLVIAVYYLFKGAKRHASMQQEGSLLTAMWWISLTVYCRPTAALFLIPLLIILWSAKLIELTRSRLWAKVRKYHEVLSHHLGLPMMLGAYLPFLAVAWYRLGSRFSIATKLIQRMVCERALVWASLSYIVLLSLASSHKEHRFLLPVTPFLLLPLALSAMVEDRKMIRSGSSWSLHNLLLSLAMTLHLLVTLFLLRYHQSGGEGIMSRLRGHILQSPRHHNVVVDVILAAPCYSLPAYGHLYTSAHPVRIHAMPCPTSPEGSDLPLKQDKKAVAAFVQSVMSHRDSSWKGPAHVVTYDTYTSSLWPTLRTYGLAVKDDITHAYFRYDYDDPHPKRRALLFIEQSIEEEGVGDSDKVED